MSLWPDSLSTRLLLLSLGAMLLMLMAAGWFLHDERNQSFQRYWQQQQIEGIARLYRNFITAPEAEWPALARRWSHEHRRIRLSPQALVNKPPSNPLERLLQGRLAQQVEELSRGQARLQLLLEHEDDDDDRRYGHRHKPELEGFLVSLQLHDELWLNLVWEVDEPVPPWAIGSLLMLLLLVLLVFMVVLLVSRRLSRPLRDLAQAAEQLGLGQGPQILPENGPREVRQTIAAFNRMQQRLQKHLQDRNLMLAAISHDLRTPLTTLRLRAEYLQDPEQKAKTLQTLQQMEVILNDTLAFARADAESESRKLDLAEMLRSLVDEFADEGHDVAYAGESQATVQLRPAALQRVLRNLLSNAMKYAGSAQVHLQALPDAWQIRICDEGPGVPEKDLQEVFTPFYRLESSRNEETGGIGLGLAIARMLVEAQGGSIRLYNRAEKGLCAEVKLPLMSE